MSEPGALMRADMAAQPDVLRGFVERRADCLARLRRPCDRYFEHAGFGNVRCYVLHELRELSALLLGGGISRARVRMNEA